MNSETIFQSLSEYIAVAHLAKQPLTDLIKEIQSVYRYDNRPWIIGYSGGKDSTAVVELVYHAILELPEVDRKKPIFVVSSDTLVETPQVVSLIKSTLARINERAQTERLPFSGHMVYPKISDSFWVNLLGKGYPTPTKQFRWCTERMKIDPVSNFIQDKVARYGEAVVVLGSRLDESASRAQVIRKHRISGSRLALHTTLSSAYVYTPIETWSADDVWDLLLSAPQPWGGTNDDLFQLYKGSNAGECPLVVDKSTPSCGNSRFGCWVCTVVTKERAIEGLIESGEVWLEPLQRFRHKLAETAKPENKPKYRNYKRRTGRVSYMRGSITQDDDRQDAHVPGPYWLRYRKAWLKELLTIQKQLEDAGRDFALIREDELHHIRSEWLHDPNEPDWSDSLPRIYRDVYGVDLDWFQSDAGAFTQEDEELLENLGKQYNISPDLIKKLLDVELSMDGLKKRRGIFEQLNTILTQDWGSLEEINTARKQLADIGGYQDQIAELQREYDSLKPQ